MLFLYVSHQNRFRAWRRFFFLVLLQDSPLALWTIATFSNGKFSSSDLQVSNGQHTSQSPKLFFFLNTEWFFSSFSRFFFVRKPRSISLVQTLSMKVDSSKVSKQGAGSRWIVTHAFCFQHIFTSQRNIHCVLPEWSSWQRCGIPILIRTETVSDSSAPSSSYPVANESPL